MSRKARYFYMNHPAQMTSRVGHFPADSRVGGFLTFYESTHPFPALQVAWPASANVGDTGCCGSFSVLFGHHVPSGVEVLEIFKATRTAILHIHTLNQVYGVANPMGRMLVEANKIYPTIATIQIVHQENKDYIIQLNVTDIPAWDKIIKGEE